MNILLWIILGLVSGWLASVVMKTNQKQGPLMDIFLGIMGALVGGFVLSLLGQAGTTGFNLYSLLVATLGAILLIFLGRMVNRSV